MTTAILITTISIIGLIFSLSKKGLFQKGITIGLFTLVLITWTADRNVLLLAILLQLGLAVTSTIYGLTVKELKKSERIIIGITGLILTLGTIATIQHYPGQAVLRFALIIPIVFFLWSILKNGLQQPKEFGFMLIWTSIAAEQLIAFLINQE